jgi:hypothetical protein
VIIGAGAIVAALLIFVATSMRHGSPVRDRVQRPKAEAGGSKEATAPTGVTSSEQSLFPITDSGRPRAKESHEGFLNERDLDRTANRQQISNASRPPQPNSPGSLGAIPSFGGEQQAWQASPYQPGTGMNGGSEAPDLGKAEREGIEKSSLVYVRQVSAAQTLSESRSAAFEAQQEIGLGLRTGTRLRARLESAASTAVRTPVLAVIEYNYERDGEIVVPAGAKAVGHIQEADRSGYMRIQFESLLMPDGTTVPIQAAATDLECGPLKGRVDGKNTGKNVLVRSLAGIGQAGAMLVGRGSLNQPLSESDLLRERVSNNIGEASDEQISKMAITQHIIVTVSAGTPIYVVLERTPNAHAPLPQGAAKGTENGGTSMEELRQLLQLKRELNAPTSGSQ